MGANVTVTRNAPEGRRVSVQLDPGMLIEALILERLNTLPKRRHQDWIRTLLVQGFLAENRVNRQLSGKAAESPVRRQRVPRSHGSGFDLGDWHLRSVNSKPVVSASPDVPKEASPRPVKDSGAEKPFAHLRKVVG